MKKINLLVVGLLLLATSYLLPATTYAAANVSIKIEEPKTPTNNNDFNITFVALDTENRTITVKCFKKSPSDLGFTQFGSDINLSAGGNTNSCHVSSNLINTTGIFQFYAQANAEGDLSTSSTVSVEYKTGGPQTPYNYSKEKLSNCEYKIRFKTAADNGLTKKVEIYSSSSKSFSADSGTKVGEVVIGSDQEGSINIVVPDCNKSYYFVIRAFDDAGSGSGVTGDSEVTVITTASTTTTSTTTQTQGAIPVGSSQVSNSQEILGTTSANKASESGKVLGSETKSSTADQNKKDKGSVLGISNLFSAKNLLLALFAAIVAVAGFFLYRKFKT